MRGIGQSLKPTQFRQRGVAWLGALVCLLAAGCAAPSLEQARSHFFAARFDTAEAVLTNLPAGKDRVLYLMERGMIRQLRGDYAGSTRDWQEAVQLEEALETHSVSKAGASMVVNDTLLAFRGYPFERTLLHTFLAKNYLALGLWEEAAVEARNIIYRLEQRDGFPDDPYSRYLAGVCLQLVGDEGASLQFRLAAAESGLLIDEHTGWLSVTGVVATPPRPDEAELICFIGFDRLGAWGAAGAPYAELYARGRYLGRSHALVNTARLAAESEKQMAARRTAKSLSRIIVKESVASAVGHRNRELGELLRFVLFSLEAPDERRWETLPRWLAVARVPCPPALDAFEVVYRDASGTLLGRSTVTRPLQKKGRSWISFCRSLQ